ncbi:MAG: Ldh family oxidoreductase [Candidatus Puniceispirillales bacterium]
MTTLTPARLKDIITAALEASNTRPEAAAAVADALTLAEIDGKKGHGLSRVPSYAAQARSGKVDGMAIPRINQVKPAVLAIDAAHGFAYPAFEEMQQHLPPVVRQQGIGLALVSHSHHYGVAGHHVERLAEAGFVALLFGNTPAAMAPHGGKTPLFGTNPVAFAAPLADRPPMVIDLATSSVARGNILTAAQKGEPIPEGWALDADGRPTTDPEAALKGSMVPMGDAKGAALALMIEVLAAGLTGSAFADEASSFFEAEGPPPNTGQVMLAIDPGVVARDMLERLSDFAARIENDGGRLPGSTRLVRRGAAVTGITVDQKALAAAQEIAGLPLE